jgi:hypothetical protein
MCSLLGRIVVMLEPSCGCWLFCSCCCSFEEMLNGPHKGLMADERGIAAGYSQLSSDFAGSGDCSILSKILNPIPVSIFDRHAEYSVDSLAVTSGAAFVVVSEASFAEVERMMAWMTDARAAAAVAAEVELECGFDHSAVVAGLRISHNVPRVPLLVGEILAYFAATMLQ